MTEIDKAWENVVSFITENNFTDFNAYSKHEFSVLIFSSLKVLHDASLTEVLQEWLEDEVIQRIRLEISPQFWASYRITIPDDKVINLVSDSFATLYSGVAAYVPCFQRLHCLQTFIESEKVDLLRSEEKFFISINSHLKGIVFHNNHTCFKEVFARYLRQSLATFEAGQTISEKQIPRCSNCHRFFDGCPCVSIFEKLKIFMRQLKHLQILETVVAEPIMEFIHEKIVSHVTSQCMSDFEKCYIDPLNYWIQNNIVKWLDDLFGSVFGSNVTSITLLPSHVKRLKFYTAEVYGKLRIEQLFDIIIDFPESLPVLQDLVVCLNLVPELKTLLVESLKIALQTRLLHSGVYTGDILTAYVSTMKALRVLDQRGVLLEIVGEPVKEYLREKEDTVRCIVTSFTEDNNNELAEELTRGRPLTDDDSGDESNFYNWEFWEPDPVEAEPLKPSQASRSFDIISMLIDIYGSKELFIEEYRSLLADRILTQLSYDTQREIRHVELLKLRFGETQLHQCEVMLKDVSDSRRINVQIAERENPNEMNDIIPISAMILSAQFWPPRLRDENVCLPNCLSESMEYYKKSFELLKGNRTLNWKPHLGLVEIEIELNGKFHQFNVSPVHAAIIWHFQTKPKYTIGELSSLLQMPTQALHRKISFWHSQGLLREESNDTFVLVDELKTTSQESMSMDDDSVESVLVSAQDQKEEETQVIWSYVVGMLTNLESLPLERIHAMLKMFAMHGPGSQCTVIELKSILETKIKELKLVYTNGLYRLNSS